MIGFNFDTTSMIDQDNYFSERVDDYRQGLQYTFALVDKEHRRNGLWGKMFIYAEENILPKYNVDRIYLATAGTNNTLQNVAEKIRIKTR